MNKTPLQIIQAERKALKKQFLSDEKKIAENISYLHQNWGSLLINTAVNHVKEYIGFPVASSKDQEGDEQFNRIQSITKIASSVLPIAWDFLQPLILKYTFRKIKNMFFGKKKNSN